MSDLQVTPPVLFMAPWLEGGGEFMLFYKAGRKQPIGNLLSSGALPLGFCLSHTGQSPLTFAFNEDKLWMSPKKTD